jgi:hypothetical protein
MSTTTVRTVADVPNRVQFLAQLVDDKIALSTTGTPKERDYALRQLSLLDEQLKYYCDILDGTFGKQYSATVEEVTEEPK